MGQGNITLGSTEFDGYHRWLGIPKREQPPHHYRLLGISLFEDDLEVIDNAASSRLAALRQPQSGPHAALCTRLLNEVCQARLCLLKADRKAAYDAQLSAALQPTPDVDGGEDNEQADVAFDVEPSAIAGRPTLRRRQSPPVLVPALLGGITAWFILWQLNLLPPLWEQEDAQKPRRKAKSVANASIETPAPQKTSERKRSDAAVKDEYNPLGIEGRLVADDAKPTANPPPEKQSDDSSQQADSKPVAADEKPAEVATTEQASRAPARREPWANELKSFEAAKRDADKKMVRAFDTAIAKISKNKIWPAETRNRNVSIVGAEKTRFEANQALPASDLMLPATLDYLGLLLAKSLPLRKAFQAALEKVVLDKDEFARVSNEKGKWESKLPGRDQFTSSSNWHGNRTFNDGNTVDFHVHVFEITGNSFKGHIWQDVHAAGKSGWEFDGHIEGNGVVLGTTKMLHGRPRQLNLHGYVIDNRLVFRTFVNGKPSNDFVSISKQ